MNILDKKNTNDFSLQIFAQLIIILFVLCHLSYFPNNINYFVVVVEKHNEYSKIEKDKRNKPE